MYQIILIIDGKQMKNAKFIVKYVDNLLHNNEITREDDIYFCEYFYSKMFQDIILYKYSDIVSTLKLKLKEHINVEDRDKYEDAQRYVYIIKSFKNLFVDMIDKSEREIYINTDELMYKEETDGGIYDTQRDIAAKNFIREMNKFVSKLPSIDRDVYYMCYVNGMTNAEAGRALGITGERVRQYRHRLKGKLTSTLNDLYLKYKEGFE